MKKFKGKIMHTAEWDGHYELSKGVVGNGAGAVQLIPEVVKLQEENLIQELRIGSKAG